MLEKNSQLKALKPVREEVLQSQVEISQRLEQLKKAAYYGTRFKVTSVITIVTIEGEVLVRSCLMLSNDSEVLLRGGVKVRICAIKAVAFEF